MNVFKMMLACLMMFAFSAVNAEVPEKYPRAKERAKERAETFKYTPSMKSKLNSEISESQ